MPTGLRSQLEQTQQTIDLLARRSPKPLRQQVQLASLRRRAGAIQRAVAWLEPAFDVDAELEGLPLLELARDVARRYDSFTIVKTDLHTEAHDLTGLTCWQGWDVVVMIDSDHIAASGYDLDRIWAHELAHTIDYLDGRVHMGNGRKRDVNRREDFANTLNDWLLEEPLPTTLHEVRKWLPRLRRELRDGTITFTAGDYFVPEPGLGAGVLAALAGDER